MKAQTLPEVIRAFDPMHPLRGQELKEWYIDRPGNPLERMKIYLQGLGLANEPVKILFTGHVGSGKSTTLNKLAVELKRRFFIVPFDVRESASMADLTYIDLVLGMATSLFKRATEADVLAKAPAQIVGDVWDDLRRFIETVIFGPAIFRTPPAGAELSAKVNFLAVEFQTKFAREAATRDEIRKRIEPRLAELHDRINQVADLVLANYKRPVLFFVENTDKPDLKRARDIFLGHTYTLTPSVPRPSTPSPSGCAIRRPISVSLRITSPKLLSCPTSKSPLATGVPTPWGWDVSGKPFRPAWRTHSSRMRPATESFGSAGA